MVSRALGLIGWFYFLSPWPVARAAASGMGQLLRVLGWRRGVARSNLEICYPGSSEKENSERNSIFLRSYSHLGHLIFEIFMLLGPMKNFVKTRVRALGVKNWREAHARGKGVIFLSSHVGNWEIMAAQGGLLNMELMIVTKRLSWKWLHRAIERGRKRVGVSGTYEPRTFRDVLKHLRDGKTVGFVLDQYAGPPIGVRVPFFGRPVGTASVVAAVAKRTGAAVLPVLNYRMPDGTWRVEVHREIPWKRSRNPTRELAENTARYVAVLETHVRAHPEQWLWVHRRFKGDLSPLKEGEWDSARTRR